MKKFFAILVITALTLCACGQKKQVDETITVIEQTPVEVVVDSTAIDVIPADTLTVE